MRGTFAYHGFKGKGQLGRLMLQSSKTGTPRAVFSKLEGTLKVRYLGIGFIWAWICGSYQTFAVYPDRPGIGIHADTSWVVSATAVMLTLFALGIASGLLTGFGTGTLNVLWGQALGLLAMFSLAWLLYPANRPLRRPSATLSQSGSARALAPALPDCPRDAATGNLASAQRESETTIDGMCQQLTLEHGLSGREAEILAYLARGRSQPYIREELVLSKNTVATHVKHIYQKLNVHSRQELLDLFE